MTDLSYPEFNAGEVWLVGAGPGDPRLLTLFAVHAIRSGDVVVHDDLIDRRILDFAAPEATIVSAGKRGGKPSPHQSDINGRLIELAREGRKVVRLKGGDPFVFGRGGEEAQALAAAGISFRIIPGLTSGLTAAALNGIPATTRLTNHAVILATGHRALDEAAERDWAAMARTGQPIIFYMAMSNLERIASVMMAAGLAADTPVTIIASATYDSERALDTTLASAVTDARDNGIGAPAIIIIGGNAALRPVLLPHLLRSAP
ncbi:uroporphyrinogen-III C-methyltransferase [Hyphomicrobium sulfonivorans]|uniref:uroporphyrinogen-III C-methyltransferase n=1 Tax=Hyphomicrobium sulfonivorans TaxID=121290 RepID=A0A109BB41_HYPSL|nr:uroporphyrinogen-III C-methyltransferase [Hyphomicrobium sulfonivorans]KWT65379.1 Uroporphyrinogen-III methyltransferase [Hyphomicrobium sulfonivorans]MBI1650918.1 uroporphyrinogen-III C-methyltransferase [Hyphomicrobium sulfonivorans]NSL72699.1 uroporphyrinogen-III C-methyltransferase [Hyphomicrobium sulfonivorans]